MVSIELLLSIFGGYTVVLAALCTFLGKVWINRIQTEEKSKSQESLAKLKAELEKKITVLSARNESVVHVSKIQFEKEYAHYEEVWRRLPLLSQQIEMLLNASDKPRSFLDMYNSLGKMKDEQERSVANAHPFISLDVYNELMKSTESFCTYENCIFEHLMFLKNITEKQATFNSEDFIRINDFKSKIKEFKVTHHNVVCVISRAIQKRNSSMIVII